MNDEDIEKAVLYYIIFEKEECELTEKDFVNQTHKKIIKAINSLKAQKQELSILSIKNKIDSNSNKILTYLAGLGDYISFSKFDTVYSLLKNYTKKRQIYNLAKEVQTNMPNIENIDNYIEKLISNLQKIEFQTEKDENFFTQIENTLKDLEEKIKVEEDYSLYTGFFGLDALTDGLHNGELTVIGARPRSRKNNIYITSC